LITYCCHFVLDGAARHRRRPDLQLASPPRTSRYPALGRTTPDDDFRGPYEIPRDSASEFAAKGQDGSGRAFLE
jgi:hypothetical protein